MNDPTQSQDTTRPGSTPTRVGQPPERRPQGNVPQGFDSNRPTIVALLYLVSLLVGVTSIVGVVLAHMWKGDAENEPWMESHLTYHIRTFWFGLLGAVIGTVLTVILIGFLILMAVAVWFVVRTVVAFMRAQKREPMPDPETLLI